jgi:predicted enzyme related to lactoylglutathione lyase
MGQRASHSPGTFSWTDLSTTDQDSAKAFYGSLFDWQFDEQPVGEDVVYSMALIDGQPVAAISPQPQQQRDAGVPPLWNSYVTVASADAALARARELGATVHADAFDVMDAGRMGVIQDPQGAFFEVWEPRGSIGAQIVNAHGALSWNELSSPDLDGSARFYEALFGWKTQAMEGMPMDYRVITRADGGSNGGMTEPMAPGVPAHWLVYFGTEQLNVSAEKAGALGGKVMAGPMDIGAGQIAVLSDPQGAVFALYSGHFDD